MESTEARCWNDLYLGYSVVKMAPVSTDNVGNVEQEKSNVIRFNVTKNELYKLDDGYKTLMRRQKGYFKIVTNKWPGIFFPVILRIMFHTLFDGVREFMVEA